MLPIELFDEDLLYKWAKNKQPGDGILLLTNNSNFSLLYKALLERGENIAVYSGKIDITFLETVLPQLVISYNYSHIIRKEIIDFMKGSIINIHISLLPWNRGAHPNFWSFIDNTPKGVTVHLIDEGLDTGMILCQKELTFNEDFETFRSTYDRLNFEAVSLIVENWNAILNKKIIPNFQPLGGSYHSINDFNKYIAGKDFSWDTLISEFKRKQ